MLKMLKERSSEYIMALQLVHSADLNGFGRGGERRIPGRFPIERELRFRVTNKRDELVGSGRTVNMSSKGLLFRTEQRLLAGKRVELAISWPAQLDQKCGLKLVARGKVVRTEPGMAAVSIDQYEFRTLGRSGLAL